MEFFLEGGTQEQRDRGRDGKLDSTPITHHGLLDVQLLTSKKVAEYTKRFILPQNEAASSAGSKSGQPEPQQSETKKSKAT